MRGVGLEDIAKEKKISPMEALKLSCGQLSFDNLNHRAIIIFHPDFSLTQEEEKENKTSSAALFIIVSIDSAGVRA